MPIISVTNGAIIPNAWFTDVQTAVFGGTAGQIWVSSGSSGIGVWTNPSAITVGNATNATNVLGVVGINNGGTGATSATNARTNLGLGTSAVLNTGTAANNVVQLDASAKLPAVDGSALLNLPIHGQCRLTLSGANLKLIPYCGNKLLVNGTLCTIPAAGVTLTTSGLSASTLYYIYATQSAGVVNALIASGTAHSTDTVGNNLGVEIMTGDATKTLVGMARTTSTTTFADSSSQRFVASWFNRGYKNLFSLPASRTTSSTTAVELLIASERVEFISWADDTPMLSANTAVSNNTGGAASDISLRCDGLPGQSAVARVLVTNANETVSVSRWAAHSLSEGYHFVTIYGAASAGILTMLGGGFTDMSGQIWQ